MLHVFFFTVVLSVNYRMLESAVAVLPCGHAVSESQIKIEGIVGVVIDGFLAEDCKECWLLVRVNTLPAAALIGCWVVIIFCFHIAKCNVSP